MYYILLSLMLSPFSFGLSFFYTEEAPKYEVPEYTPPKIKPKPMACLSNNEMIQKGIFYCPRIEKLRKEGMKWVAGEPWKAYSESFVERIDRFSGAQWTGPSGPVGRLLCFYEGVQKNNFPVKITTTTLIRKPDLPLWEESEGSKGTIFNCVSINGNVCDCPFKIATNVEKTNQLDTEDTYVQTEATIESYQQAEVKVRKEQHKSKA